MDENDKPFPIEDFLASVTEALKIRGDARAITVIAEGESRFDSWFQEDVLIFFWTLNITLPIHIFYALSDEELLEVKRAIGNVGEPLLASAGVGLLSAVEIRPKMDQATETWREEAIRFVKGEGVTNQGRVRSDNIASQQHQGLLFRSKAEITLFEAMKRAQLAVAPLPVFVRVGNRQNRIEPDFVVVRNGLTFVVEVDGDTYHKESPADADKRLVPLTIEGVEVRRIRAADVATDALADAVVRGLIQFMDRRKEAR
jgi:very-short-patch-repair endonuclease